MQNQPTPYKGCPVCSNPSLPVSDNNYKVTCANCGEYLITGNAINDWLLASIPDFRKKEAVVFIHNNKSNVLIESSQIQNFIDKIS